MLRGINQYKCTDWRSFCLNSAPCSPFPETSIRFSRFVFLICIDWEELHFSFVKSDLRRCGVKIVHTSRIFRISPSISFLFSHNFKIKWNFFRTFRIYSNSPGSAPLKNLVSFFIAFPSWNIPILNLDHVGGWMSLSMLRL